MRQYSGMTISEKTNGLCKYLLSQGNTVLSITMDLPAQIGLDSDGSRAAEEVDRAGAAIDSLADMEAIFGGIPMDKISTSMTINDPAAVLLAMYVAAAEKKGIRPEQLKGTIQNDILKEYIARGTCIFPPGSSMRLVTDTFACCSRNIPRGSTITVGDYHIRETGASITQEIAFAFFNAIACIETLTLPTMERAVPSSSPIPRGTLKIP